MFQQLINPINLEAVTNFHLSCRRESYANSFFPHTTEEWNNLTPEIHKSVLYEVFKNLLLKFIRPPPNSLSIVSWTFVSVS